jgi:proteasome lid subunit RPN8/RPN11
LIIIPEGLRDELHATGIAALPREAVGFVFGHRETPPDRVRAERLIPLQNIAESNEMFQLDAHEVAEVLAAYPASRTQSASRMQSGPRTLPASPLALFHSHPNDIAAPSTLDVRGAAGWTDLLHLILSLKDRPTLRCFRIFDGQVLPERIVYE